MSIGSCRAEFLVEAERYRDLADRTEGRRRLDFLGLAIQHYLSAGRTREARALEMVVRREGLSRPGHDGEVTFASQQRRINEKGLGGAANTTEADSKPERTSSEETSSMSTLPRTMGRDQAERLCRAFERAFLALDGDIEGGPETWPPATDSWSWNPTDDDAQWWSQSSPANGAPEPATPNLAEGDEKAILAERTVRYFDEDDDPDPDEFDTPEGRAEYERSLDALAPTDDELASRDLPGGAFLGGVD